MIETLSLKTADPVLDPITAAKSVAPIVNAEAALSEQQRHLTTRTVETMKHAGLYRLLTPRCLGGLESDPVIALQTIEEVSHADGATGWCLMVGALEIGAAGAFLGDEAIKTIFKEPTSIIAGQGVPRGRAVPEKDGYRLSGQYSYGSGIAHADYVQAGAIVFDGERPRMTPYGMPEMRVFHVKRSEVQFGDNWHVLGLRGTGSFDYTIQDSFLSEDFSYAVDEKTPKRGGSLYTLGLVGFTALGHTGFALGAGRRALDEIALIAAKKETLFGRVGDAPSFQEKFALAEAKMHAARSYCIDVWGDVARTLDLGRSADTKQIARLRLGLRYAHDTASEVSTFAHRASGGVSLRDSTLQRCYRDIHAATQHLLMSDQITQACGKSLLGLAPEGSMWTVVGLMEPPQTK